MEKKAKLSTKTILRIAKLMEKDNFYGSLNEYLKMKGNSKKFFTVLDFEVPKEVVKIRDLSAKKTYLKKHQKTIKDWQLYLKHLVLDDNADVYKGMDMTGEINPKKSIIEATSGKFFHATPHIDVANSQAISDKIILQYKNKNLRPAISRITRRHLALNPNRVPSNTSAIEQEFTQLVSKGPADYKGEITRLPTYENVFRVKNPNDVNILVPNSLGYENYGNLQRNSKRYAQQEMFIKNPRRVLQRAEYIDAVKKVKKMEKQYNQGKKINLKEYYDLTKIMRRGK